MRKYTAEQLKADFKARYGREINTKPLGPLATGLNTGSSSKKETSGSNTKEYTSDNLKTAFMTKNGREINTTSNGPTAMDYALELAKAKQEKKELIMPQNAFSVSSTAQKANKDMRNTNTSYPTNKFLISQMSDDEITSAVNVLYNNRSRVLGLGHDSSTLDLEESKGYDKKIDAYVEEFKKRNEEREAVELKQKTANYYVGREKKYEKLSDEQKSKLDRIYTISLGNTFRESGYDLGSPNVTEQMLEMQQLQEELTQDGVDVPKMMEYHTRVKNEKNAATRDELLNESGAGGMVGHNIASVGASVLSGIDLLQQAGTSVHNAVSEEYIPYDTNAAKFTNYRNAVRQNTTDRIENNTVGFLYSAGMSMADSAAAMATGTEALSLGTMGASAASNAYVDTIKRGTDTNKAFMTAAANGVAEAAMEMLGLDHLYSIAKPAGKAGVKTIIKDVIAQAGIEGSEEVLTTFADEAADRIINGDMSAYETNIRNYMENGYTEAEAKEKANADFWTGVRDDFVAGTISGGVFGSAGSAYSAVQYHKLGNYANSNEDVKQAVMETAGTMDEGTTAREIVNSKQAEQINDKDMAHMIESVQGVSKNDVQKQELLYQLHRGYEAEQYYRKAAEKNQTSVVRAFEKGSNTPVVAVKLENINGNRATVKLGDGSVTDLSNINIQDPIKQKLYNFATTMETAEAGNAVIERYAGEPVTSYAEACAVFYNAGKLGATSYEEVLNNPKNSRNVGIISNTATLKTMYELGVNSRNVKVAPVQPAKITDIVKPEQGIVIDNRTDNSDMRIKDIAEQVAAKTGLEITLNDSLSHGENGHFQKALSRIALSGKSHNEYETLVHELNEFAESYNPEGMKTVVDSVLNYAATKEGSTYLTQRITQYHNAYKRVEAGKTYESSSEEFVFDYLAGVFSSKDGVEDFSRYMTENKVSEQEQKTVLETIADFFKQIIDKITSYLDEHVLSETAKKGLEADVKKAKELREMVLKTWDGAIENYHRDTSVKKTSKEKKYSFAGANAENADRNAMTEAMTMEQQGKTAEEIFEKTGWFRGADKQWRFEIDDSKAKIFWKGDAQLLKDPLYVEYQKLCEEVFWLDTETEEGKRKFARYEELAEMFDWIYERQKTLRDYVEHQELMEAYPFLANIRIKEEKLEPGLKGRYVPSENIIVINKDLFSEYTDIPLLRTILHEVQHIIQHYERFSGGATTNTWKDIDIKQNQYKYEMALKVQKEAFKGGSEEFKNLIRKLNQLQLKEDFGEEYDYIENELMQKYEQRYNQYDNALFEARLYKNSESLSEYLKYEMTAGEIEARDTENRVKLTQTERKEKFPTIKTEKGVIFVENKQNPFEPGVSKGNIAFSISVDDDGIENYTTSKKTLQLSYKERQKKLLEIMRKEYAGRTAKFTKEGKVYYALYDQMSLKKGVYGDKKSDEAGKKAKINIGADGNYIELAENALYSNSSIEQGKNSKFHKNAKVWDYYVKTIKSDGIYYDVLINVKDTGNEQYVYDITLRRQENKKSSPLTNYGLKGGRTTSYTKSIPQNSKKESPNVQNVTKKYSINIDDSLFAALEDTYSVQEQDTASIVKEGFEVLQNVTVNEQVMGKIAYAIKKEYKSKCNLETLKKNLTSVFAYLKNTEHVQYEDMVRIVQEVAKPVIEESTDIDTFEKEMYDNVRNYLKGQKIRLNDEQKDEAAYYYGSYDKFRKMNFGNITFSDDGTYLDSIWTELCDNSYQLLDYETSVADQPMAVVNLLDALKPTKKNIYGMDTEAASYDLALDIFRRFFVEQAEEKANKKVTEKSLRLIERQQEYRKRVKREYDERLNRMREAESQRRKKMYRYYEDKIYDLKQEQKAALEYKDTKRHNEIKRREEVYQKMLATVKQQANDRILQIKAVNRQNAVNKRRNEDLRRYRERIKKNASGIITYFNSNTDKKHVPEGLKDAVAGFITSIDFVSERSNPDSMAALEWQNSLNQLHRKLKDKDAAKHEGYEEVYNALLDEDNGDTKVSSLLSDMSAFIDSNSGIKIYDMNMQQLQQLDEMITALKRAITTVNQLYVNKRTNNVETLGNATLTELATKKDKKKSGNKGVQAVDNLLNVNMLDSRSFFYRLGDAAGTIYEGLRDGFSERVWLLKEAQEYMNDVLAGKKIKKWTGEHAEVHTFIIKGKELRMTTGQIMSLYELNKRKQANIHLKVGGIRPSEFKTSNEVVRNVKGLPLTDYEIDNVICAVLTPEQRAVADAMQRFLANNCADWGNRTTMKMYGYKRFGVKDYFPIKTDGNSVDTRDETRYWATKNQGFTKETMKNASNALIVDDIFDVFTKHVADMATYSAFTAPLADAMKWFNYKLVEKNDKGVMSQSTSIKTEIDRVYGSEYLEYFKKLIQDINAETTKGSESQISDSLMSRMKAASVGANIRVAIQQPTAYLRAMAVMSPKYLGASKLKKWQIVKGVKKAKKYSAIAQWKAWGYFETSIGMSMKNIITGQDTLRNKVVEKSMFLAQLGDDVTWGYLWNACEAEIKDKHPDLTYDSEEFIEATARRFDEVVDQTQVVDTVLHRSQIMRSTDWGNKMATAFMAEPTKSYNLLMNAVRDVKESGGKNAKAKLARTVTVYTLNQVINAAVVSVIDAMRDDEDDDDTFKDKYIEAFKENVIDNMNPLGMIPYAKDILSLLNGYDVARMDMQGIGNLISGAQNVWKYFNDEDYRSTHTMYDVFKNLLRGVSQVMGIPYYNLLRDVESFYNTFTGEHLGGIKRSNKRQYERMVDALIENNTEKYSEIKTELLEKDESEKDINSGVFSDITTRYANGTLSKKAAVKLMKKQDEKLDENEVIEKLDKKVISTVKATYLEDKITKEAAEKQLEKMTDLSNDEIFIEIRGWDYKKEHPSSDTENLEYYYLYDAIDNTYKKENVSDRKAVEKEIKILEDSGYEAEDIVKAVRKHVKERYLADEVKKEIAEDILSAECEMTADDVYWELRGWDYYKMYPEKRTSDYNYLYDAIDAAYESGKLSDREAIRTEIKTMRNHGYEKSKIIGQITDHYKEQYLELRAKGTAADMKNLLISAYMMAGMSHEDAKEKIEKWKKKDD